MRAEELAPDSRVLSEDGHILGLGGWAAIFGSPMGGIAILLHPYLPLDDDFGIATAISESDAWVPIHPVIVFGIILMLGGLVGLQRSLRGGLGVALARFGLAAAVAGVWARTPKSEWIHYAGVGWLLACLAAGLQAFLGRAPFTPSPMTGLVVGGLAVWLVAASYALRSWLVTPVVEVRGA